MTSHVRRYHQHYQSHGHVWQGRFKSFPIQQDGHFLTVLRYVYRNPVRAGLAATVVDWPWSSLRWSHLSDPLPLELPSDWLEWIDRPLFNHELSSLPLAKLVLQGGIGFVRAGIKDTDSGTANTYGAFLIPIGVGLDYAVTERLGPHR